MTTTYHQLVAAAKQRIVEVNGADVEAKLSNGPILLDVREADEFDQGTIPGARFLPRGVLEENIPRFAPDPSVEVVLFCSAGNRSALAAEVLQDMGYRNVASLAGGFTAWKAQGRPWDVPGGLDASRRARYARHLVLPEVGEAGQERLLGSRVLVIGAGGLGSPVALYLAAAGVGTLGIVDFDVVDATNLQRQIIHATDRLGMLKTASATETIGRLNPDVRVLPFPERLSADNVLRIMDGFDVVVDGTDSFPTRYLINDAALHLKVPVVHGSIFRFEGQATVFTPYEGPCYRCLFPEPPPPELAPSCAEAGVLGVLPGIIGSIQAMEALKLVLGIGDSLAGRLLVYDALAEDFRNLSLGRDPDCPACADETRPPVLVEYDPMCRPAGTAARTG